MKVLLVNPPRFHELIGKNPAIVEKHRGFNPPLGILSLAGFLELHSNHEVEVLDAQPHGWSYAELKDILAAMTFDVCGITAMTFTLIDVVKTCRIVREVNPSCKIVLGGPHVHLFPEETIGFPEVDFLIQGEGEIAFAELLEKLDEPARWNEVPGIVYIDSAGSIVNNGVAPSTSDLDQLGIPARGKLDVGMYTSVLGRDNVITTMFTSRGCPYRCTFCDRPFSPVISGFRWRTAQHIVEEIEQCRSLGITEAFIYDDTFTVRKDRVHELCDEIIRRKIKFRWDVRAHVNTVNEDLLKHMAAAGCDRIHYGVESGNDRMLRTIRKNTDVARIKAAVKLTKEAGMEVLTYFIIGQQTETASDIQDSMALARELKPNYAHFTVFCPYPGTEIYAKGLESGIIKEDVWAKFAQDPSAGFELPVWEEIFTRQELREMLVKCYKSFYLRPKYVLGNLVRVRGVGEFKRKMRAGLSVLTMTPNQKVYDESEMTAKVHSIVPGAPTNLHS
ncbi:MAG: B12-binding domain-containing radical SAM protein [Alphaproteobacteria bacterium]|nr:B12-binding domain-containing radical SAM protein [Alphaproteobacteria bacterium]